MLVTDTELARCSRLHRRPDRSPSRAPRPFTLHSSGGPVQTTTRPSSGRSSTAPDGIAGNGSACASARSGSPRRGDVLDRRSQHPGAGRRSERATQKTATRSRARRCGSTPAAARRPTRPRPASRCSWPARRAGLRRLDFNKVLSTHVGPQPAVTNGAFDEFVPSTDTGGGWTSSTHRRRRRLAPDLSALSLGGSFILNDNGVAAPNPKLRRPWPPSAPACLPARPAASSNTRGGDADHRGLPRHAHRRRAERRDHIGARSTAGARSARRSPAAPARTRHLDRRRVRQRRLATASTTSRVQAEYLRQLRHQVRRPSAARALHRRLGPQGRARPRATGRRSSRSTTSRGRLQSASATVVAGAGGNDVLIVDPPRASHGPRRDARHLLRPGQRARSRPAGHLRRGHRELPPARQPRGQGLLRRRAGARPVQRRGAHLRGPATTYRLRPLQPGPQPVLDPFGNPLTLRDRRPDPPHRRRPGHPRSSASRRPGSAASRRVRRAAQRGLHGRDALPARARPGQLYDRGERLYDLVEAFGCSAENVVQQPRRHRRGARRRASYTPKTLLPADRHRRRHASST